MDCDSIFSIAAAETAYWPLGYLTPAIFPVLSQWRTVAGQR